MYDVTDRGSFNSIRNWVGQIQQHADVHVNKILIGNKCDMEEQRVVSVEEGKQLAKEYGIQFFETSAKNDIEVETVGSSVSLGAPATFSFVTIKLFVCYTHGLPCCCARACVITGFRFAVAFLQGFTTVAREVKNRLVADGPQRPAAGGVKPSGKKEAKAKSGCC